MGGNSSKEDKNSNIKSCKSQKAQKKDDDVKTQDITLHYFPARGRAEFIRILLAVGGVKYTRRDVTQAEWGELKMTEYEGNGLPVLDVGKKRLFQSNAIARYIAVRTGQAGKDHFEMAQVDMVVDTVQDIVDASFKCFGQLEKLKEYVAGDFKKTMDNLEKFINENKNSSGVKCMVGEKFTWADFKLYTAMEFITTQSGDPDAIKSWGGISALCKGVPEDPTISGYLKSRPDTPF